MSACTSAGMVEEDRLEADMGVRVAGAPVGRRPSTL